MTFARAITATLAYHDIFAYPLTLPQVHHFLVGKKATQAQVSQELARLDIEKKIGSKDGYFYLKGRSKIVSLRKQRSRWSKAKLKKARFFAQILKVIPTIRLVAVSGALAMENSHKNDDIDLVLVTAKGTLWTTRFLVNILLLPFKRDPQGKKIADRACLNVFLEESALMISPQNLYLAHEICQMKPLWERGGTYQKFIGANQWVTKFLPNWEPLKSETAKQHSRSEQRQKSKYTPGVGQALEMLWKPLETFLILIARRAEWITKWGQLSYMRPKITTEKIGEHQLFFHPSDTENWVLKEYLKRLKRLKADVV